MNRIRRDPLPLRIQGRIIGASTDCHLLAVCPHAGGRPEIEVDHKKIGGKKREEEGQEYFFEIILGGDSVRSWWLTCPSGYLLSHLLHLPSKKYSCHQIFLPPPVNPFNHPSNKLLRWRSAVGKASVAVGWARCSCWLHGNLASPQSSVGDMNHEDHETHQRGDLAPLVGCALLWHGQQVERIRHRDISLMVLAPTINEAARDEL
jgi:hypothetical protein